MCTTGNHQRDEFSETRNEDRRFRDYRTDITLDLRQTKLALRRLRQLTRSGLDELDVDDSISETCRNGGEIELVFRPEKKNNILPNTRGMNPP